MIFILSQDYCCWSLRSKKAREMSFDIRFSLFFSDWVSFYSYGHNWKRQRLAGKGRHSQAHGHWIFLGKTKDNWEINDSEPSGLISFSFQRLKETKKRFDRNVKEKNSNSKINRTRWLKFRLVNWTGAKVRYLYFLKVLPLGCSKLILGNSLISIPVRHWTKTKF